MKRMWRLAGVGCIAHVVLLLAGYSQQKSPMFGATPAEVVKTYAGVPATKMYVGGFLITLAWLVLLATLTLVARLLVVDGGTPAGGWLSGLISTAGTAATAVTLAGAYATAGGAYYAAAHGFSADVVAGANMVSKFADLIAMSAIGLTTIAIGAAGLASRTLPRWAAWISVVIGVVGVASGAHTGLLDIGNLLWLAWLVILGVVLMRGPARPHSSEPADNRSLAAAGLS
jgi:amino acid transporter